MSWNPNPISIQRFWKKHSISPSSGATSNVRIEFTLAFHQISYRKRNISKLPSLSTISISSNGSEKEDLNGIRMHVLWLQDVTVFTSSDGSEKKTPLVLGIKEHVFMLREMAITIFSNMPEKMDALGISGKS
jgi:hypothetical protein